MAIKAGIDVVLMPTSIGKNADVTIIAGCGIHNDHHKDSEHNGIHRFFLEEGSKVKYIEKHYGCGQVDSNKEINNKTIIIN